MLSQLVNSFDVCFENDLDEYNWMHLADNINRYTPPMDLGAYLRENEFDEDEYRVRLAQTYTPPINPEAYIRENYFNGNNDDDLPPSLIPLRDILPPAPASVSSPSYSPTPSAYYVETDSETDTVISIDDEENIGTNVIDLVSDDEENPEEEDIPIRPSVICWAGRQ